MADKSKNSGKQKNSADSYRTGQGSRASGASRASQGSAKKPSTSSGKAASSNKAASKTAASKSAASSKTTAKSKPASTKQKKTADGKKKNVGYVVSLLRSGDNRDRIISACVKLFLVLVFIILLIGLWRNRVDWSCANISQCARDSSMLNGAGEGFPLSVLGSRVITEEELSGGIAVLTDTTMTVYGSSSKQAVSRAHYLGTPAMETAGRYALLYDIGGTKYRLETVSDTLVEASAEYPIIGGGAARNGDFVIVEQGSSYASCFSSVTVYNSKGGVRYKWHCADGYITDAALSADGKYLAMCCVSAQDGSLLSSLRIHKISSQTELAKYELRDAICLSVSFTNTGTLFAVCDSKVITASNYGAAFEEHPFDGELQAYDISYESGAAIYAASGPSDESGTLTIFDSRGDQRVQKEFKRHGIAVSLSESGCCLLGRGGIEACKLSGEDIGTWDAEVAAADVLLIGTKAYVVEGISISQVRILKDMGQEN